MMSPPNDVSAARKLLDCYYSAMVHKNADELAALYAEQAIHEFPLLSPYFPQQLHGRAAIGSHYAAVWKAAAMRLQEVRETALYLTRDPEVFVAEAQLTATTNAGKQFSLSFALVVRMQGGKIVHLRDYMDALGAACALDRLPQMVQALNSKR
jgi:ketosteroid isomerase-like protein